MNALRETCVFHGLSYPAVCTARVARRVTATVHACTICSVSGLVLYGLRALGVRSKPYEPYVLWVPYVP